jgi:hypothetical protein
LWRLVAVGETEKPKIDFQFSPRIFEIPVAPLSASGFVSELSFRDSFKRDAARVIGKPFHWFAP